MSTDAWLTLAVVVIALVVMVRDLVAPTATLVTATVALYVAGVIDADQAFSGFSNPAPITVAALYVLTAAVDKSGLLQPVVGRLLGNPAETRGGRNALARLVAPTAASSAFLNNTPIVAMLVPEVNSWSDRSGQPASRFLMPLSFAAILGGVVTVLGTSTNLVVSGLLDDAGLEPLDLFEISQVGLPAAIVGLILLVALAPVLLPARRSALTTLRDEAREFVMAMEVVPGGALDGRSVTQAGLRHLQGVFLVRIERTEKVIAPVTPDQTVRGGDVLTFVGQVDQIVDLQRLNGLRSAEHHHLLEVAVQPAGGTSSFYEVVIGTTSPLVGQTVKEAEFRGRYQAAVLAIHRSGERVEGKLGDVRLRAGDTLLLLAGADFRSHWRERHDFLLVAPLAATPPTFGRQAPIVAVVAIGIVVTSATGVLDILQAALVGAIALIAARVLSPTEARDAVDIDVVVMIGASFGLGAAVATSGLAADIAGGLVDGFGGLGTWGVILGVVLSTVVLTELVTNNAAAVIMFPIALAVAASEGLDPRVVAMAVAVAASASFLTPIGYQTNTMVYGPGGYRFLDYTRLGLPVTLAMVATVTAVTTALAS